MTMHEYFMLKERGQISALLNMGTHIASLDGGDTFFELYSLSVFFVELEYEKWTNKLVGRAIFQSGLQMEKYLPDFQGSI